MSFLFSGAETIRNSLCVFVRYVLSTKYLSGAGETKFSQLPANVFDDGLTRAIVSGYFVG